MAMDLNWSLCLSAIVPIYFSLCSILRFRRREIMQKKFDFSTRDSLKAMTTSQAQEILQYLAELEFPTVYVKSLEFALFKTYGIPTISRLLTQTTELSDTNTAAKRDIDTRVLIGEFCSHDPSSPRALQALARVNYLHYPYLASGKITNTDMLYTLSLFILEPPSWCARFEWREFSQMEICAIATHWKSIGESLGIKYTGYLKRTDWRDGIEFYEDIKQWSQEYEEKQMIPTEDNKKLADALIPLLLFWTPYFMRASATKLIAVLMGARLRNAMMYPKPPIFYYYLTNIVFGIRRFVLRYLCLPRPSFMAARQVVDEPDPKTGRYFWGTWISHPFYVKPNFWNRWGPMGWFVWAMGGSVPSYTRKEHIPNGYAFEEVGPERMVGKGKAVMSNNIERLREQRIHCPFAVSQ